MSLDHRFGAAAPLSLGIEEEVVFVDGETLETAPVYSGLVQESSERLKPELFECLAELTTQVVPDAETALAELRRLRVELVERAAHKRVLIHVAGMHALAHAAGQPIVPVPRYQGLAAQLGDRIYRQLVCGLHVHVSLPDPDTCLAAFEGVVPWLPTLLALSANSPFAEGANTGRRSERAERLLEMPTGGTPPILRSWDDWTAATRSDSTRRHWDAWPRPEYGTLEVRVMDMQTDVRRSAGFAALVQALVATAVDRPAGPYDRGLYSQRRAEAAIDPPAPADVEALAAFIEPAAGDLGAWTLAAAVLAGRPEAERQIDVAASDGIAAVPGDVVERSGASLLA